MNELEESQHKHLKDNASRKKAGKKNSLKKIACGQESLDKKAEAPSWENPNLNSLSSQSAVAKGQIPGVGGVSDPSAPRLVFPESYCRVC